MCCYYRLYSPERERVCGDAMPAVTVSHVVLDVPTLFAVTLFIAVIGGLLLLFSLSPSARRQGAFYKAGQ